MKNICVVTGTRAEFGLLLPVIRRIDESKELQLKLLVTGAHLEEEQGYTKNDVIASGFVDFDEVKIKTKCDTAKDMADSIGEAVRLYADYLQANPVDMALVLGDRYEIYAFVTAATVMGIPVAHMCGGDTTEGAVDEFFRHCITKMSRLHLTSNEQSRMRVIQMGEHPDTVFNVGFTAVENFLSVESADIESIEKDLDIKLKNEKFAIVTFHSVTTEIEDVEVQVRELIKAMEQRSELKYIITKANADAGGRIINEIWDKEKETHPNWRVVSSLGMKRYLTVLRDAQLMLGNSSSGLSEAPILKTPSVNIGNRQKGRLLCESVICCECTKDSICEAIARAESEEFKKICKNSVNPYGDGNTSLKIVEIMENYLSAGISATKSFYDIKFEV